MKILFACHRLPFPPNRGGKIRPFHMIQALSQKHSVVVASLAHSEEELWEGAGLKDYCAEVMAEVLPGPVRWMQAAGALLSGIPSSVAYFRSSRLHRRVEQAWHRTRFDVVMVHCAFAAQYVLDLRGGFRILDFGDLDSAKWFDYARHRPLPLSLGYGLEARKLRRYEKQLIRRFDQCTVTTEGELDAFKSLDVAVPCQVIPNGVDPAYFRPGPDNPRGSPVIAFLGRMDYFPNVDAVVHFATKILPIIQGSVPRAELRIIGSNPTRAVRRLARRPGISVTGYVPDVRPALGDAVVAVAPLRIARGTQNKILQFMAMGIPVVASPEAARGIQALPGRDLLVADHPEGFARHVIEVIHNARLREALSRAGRRQVENAHAWPLAMSILDTILDGACAATGGPNRQVPTAVRDGSGDAEPSPPRPNSVTRAGGHGRFPSA